MYDFSPLGMAIKKHGWGQFWWVGRSTANQQPFKVGLITVGKAISPALVRKKTTPGPCNNLGAFTMSLVQYGG